MKRALFILIAILFVITISAQEENQKSDVSTYYFIRHAEKVKIESSDPELSAEGKLRAERWAKILGNISFDAIYSTDYIRTRSTTLPTAQSKGLEIILYYPRKIDNEKFLSETKGKTVLVVGHSNTTPAFVNKIIGAEKYKLIDHNTFGNLYIVEITESTVTNKLLYIN